MNWKQNLQKTDRELFSELEENPIQTSYISFQPPRVQALDPNFYLDINGNLLWDWQNLSDAQLAVAIGRNLLALGYTIKEQHMPRIAGRVYDRLWNLKNKLKKMSNGNARKLEKKSGYQLPCVKKKSTCYLLV